MARIPDDTLREIRERTNLVELIGEAVPLRKAGQSWKGLCPFHTEKTPSFTVSEGRGFFHCFGCGASGNAFDFLMRREGMTFPEAVRALARRAGVAVPSDDLSPEARRAEAERSALLAMNAAAQAFFAARLAAPEGQAAREYLAARGIAPETVQAFGLGYAPAGWDHLLRHLAAQGQRADLAARAGLAVARERGEGHYDRFRERLMIPIADPQGRVAAFGGRAMARDEPAKYLNSAESPLYRKSQVLYGLPQAREAIRRADQVLVVEGYFDCIALHQVGVRETVATCGTALTREHVQVLLRYTRNVVTLFDGDEAGMRAAERSLPLFLEAEVAARIAVLPAGEDPDTFVRRAGAEGLRELVRQARPLVEALIEARARQEDVGTVEGRVRVLRAVRPIILRIVNDRFRRDEYIKFLVEQIGRPADAEDLIRQHILSARTEEQASSRETEKSATPAPHGRRSAVSGRDADGDCLLRAVLLSPPFAAELLSGQTLAELGDPVVTAIVGVAAGLLRQGGPAAVTADGLLKTLEDVEERSRLSGVAIGLDDLALDEAAARRQGTDAARSIRVRWINAELRRLARELARMDKAPSEERAPLLARCAELNTEKHQVSRQAS